MEVEIRESLVTRSAGPRLLQPSETYEPLAFPLTSALGINIGCEAAPGTAGTGGLFVRRRGAKDKLYLVTARHVVFPTDDERHYVCDGPDPRRTVTFLGYDSSVHKYRAAKDGPEEAASCSGNM